MAELKTKEHDADVVAFIKAFSNNEQKVKDSLQLIQLMQDVTGCKPKMWGPSIVGFGKYHYKSERSAQQGEMPLIGFSPRKAALSLYVYSGGKVQEDLLKKLGKFKMGKACMYVKRLSDIDTHVLTQLMIDSVNFLKTKHDTVKN